MTTYTTFPTPLPGGGAGVFYTMSYPLPPPDDHYRLAISALASGSDVSPTGPLADGSGDGSRKTQNKLVVNKYEHYHDDAASWYTTVQAQISAGKATQAAKDWAAAYDRHTAKTANFWQSSNYTNP